MHLVDAVTIAVHTVQRCRGMALQKSQRREREVAMGAIRRRKWRLRWLRVSLCIGWCGRLAAQCSTVSLSR